MLSLTLTSHLIILESKITYLTFGKNSVNTLSLFLESNTTLNSSTVILPKKVSINVSMLNNMSMTSNQTSSQSLLCSELLELVVQFFKIIRMFQQFVNLFLPKPLDAHVILVVKQELRLRNSLIITLKQFCKKEIFGLLRTNQNKINKNTLKF